MNNLKNENNKKKYVLTTFIVTILLTTTATGFQIAEATHVDGSVITGNYECAPGLSSFKIEAPNPSPTPPIASGSYDDTMLFVTLTVTNDGKGVPLSWQNTNPASAIVKAVSLKGGPNSHLYLYTSGETSDSGLVTLVNPNNNQLFGLSNIVFCYEKIDLPPPPPPQETTEISGMKFEDANADGDKTGDSGIPDWEITLVCEDAGNNVIIGPTSIDTDANGNYLFSFDLGVPVSCTVSEESQNGWSPTTDTSLTFDVSPGDVISDKDFGNFKDVTIMGEKWNDANGNGVDDAEPRLDGWTIFLDKDNDGIFNNDDISTTTSDNPLGKYTFGPLGPDWAGDRQICEVLQTGWVNTHPGDVCISITISSGNDLGTQLPDDATDFGNVQPISAVKTWTHTDYNWEVCELIEVAPDEFAEICRPANIYDQADDVLADPLPFLNDKYQVNGNLKFDKKANTYVFQNTNPGAFYALTTVDVLVDIDSLEVTENYGQCTNSILQLLGSSQNIETALKAAIADPNGDVTEISSKDILVPPMTTSSATVLIPGPIDGGSKVFVLVKFQDNLKGTTYPNGVIDVMCDNSEDIKATIGSDEFSDSVQAALRITNQN